MFRVGEILCCIVVLEVVIYGKRIGSFFVYVILSVKINIVSEIVGGWLIVWGIGGGYVLCYVVLFVLFLRIIFFVVSVL